MTIDELISELKDKKKVYGGDAQISISDIFVDLEYSKKECWDHGLQAQWGGHDGVNVSLCIGDPEGHTPAGDPTHVKEQTIIGLSTFIRTDP